MSTFPTLTVRQVEKALKQLGFTPRRQAGSHVFFKHPDGRTTVVPFHNKRDIGRGLLRAILRDIHMIPDEFQKYV